ncbi:MAG: hypothetical protein KBT12_01270 [Bacteroidales bacterium]|nr:hypothetical protein [Candidatus Physcousia equi]
MTKYLGVALVVLGTIMLVISYLSQTLVDMNFYQLAAIVAILVGVVLHIYFLRKA